MASEVPVDMTSGWVWVRRGLSIGLIVGVLAVLGLFEGWERLSFDARSYLCTRFCGRPANLPITVVGIDDQSLAMLGRWPWPRTTLAALLQQINRQSPAVIGLDVILAEPAAGDDKLAATLPPGRIVLPVYGRGGDRVQPLPLFSAHTVLGHIEVNVDHDGVVRSVPNQRDGYLPFGVMAARLMTGESAVDVDNQFWLNMRIKEGAAHLALSELADTVSAADIMAGHVPTEKIKGRLVLIGMSATGLAGQDAHVTSLRPLGAIPGVYIHASLAAAELNGKHMRRPNPLLAGLLALAAGLAAGLLVGIPLVLDTRATPGNRYMQWIPTPIVTAAVIALLYIVTVMVEHALYALWLPLAAPLLALAGTIAWAGAEQRLALEMERRVLRRLFSRYVPPEVMPELLRRSGELGLAGVHRNVVVLFADVRGFTTLAEHLPPAQVMQVLNLYLEAMAASVRQHGGMVDKYLGDGLMAVFGAPIPHEDAVQAAIYCALDMHIRVSRLVAPVEVGALPPIGVGIHMGEAVLGTVGGKERLEYTAMGDVVNVAARLEEMTPAGHVLLSGDCVRCIKDINLQTMCEPQGTQTVRGKRLQIEVYSICCIPGTANIATEG